MILLGAIVLFAVVLACAVCALAGWFSSALWLLMLPLCAVGGFLLGVVVLALVIWAMASAVDMNGPFETDSKPYRAMVNQFIDLVIFVMRIDVVTSGLEKTPAEGRFLLVCNHRDDVDPAVLISCFKRNELAFLSKRENDAKFIVGPFLRKLLCQPVNRENDREALKAIVRCVQLLRDDEVSIGAFPEGYVFDDRKLHRFRPGVFKVAQKAKVPVVVCTLRGTTDVLPSLKKLKPSRVELRLLEVISAEDACAVSTVELSERIYRMMADDLGPELVSQEG